MHADNRTRPASNLPRLLLCSVAALLSCCGGGSTAGGGGTYGGGGGGGGGSGNPPPAASAYSMSKLVSDGALAASITDANLVNPWGIVFAANAPVWVANN